MSARVMRTSVARGQTLVEFSVAGTLFLSLLLAIVSLSVSAWSRSSVDFSMSELATQLPAGWDAMDDKTLVRELVTDNGEAAIDPSRLTVLSASVEEIKTSPQSSSSADSVARALGSENAYRSSSWVRVKARVSYRLDVGGMVIGGPVGTYTRDIDRVYLVQRRYEIS